MRLWLDHETFVEINAEGYCLQHPLEGAMGFIVPALRRRAGGWDPIAWKIPRLLADTHRENTYIEQALSTECIHVRAIAARDAKKTLIGSTAGNPFIGTVRGITHDDVDYPPDDTYWLFVAFEKDRPPRFCCMPVAIKDRQYVITDGELQPPISINRPHPLATVNIARRTGGQPAPAMVGCASYHLEAPPPIVGLIDTISPGNSPPSWYFGIASICYEWARGTLQEAIDRDARGDWDPSQHYQLFKRLLEGVRILHAENHIHGDLRPANIMYREDPHNPDHYCITDYGSFATGPGAAIAGGEPRRDGQTLLEAISALRVSPYYAPERRAGREDENADAAIFVRLEGAIVLIVGWRTHLIDQAASLAEYIKRAVDVGETTGRGTGSTSSGDDTLQRGDRIRLREFVFDVLSVYLERSFRIYVTAPLAWVVVHERLLVPARSDEIQCLPFASIDETTLASNIVSLSRVIELPRWTSASDIYAIGVIAMRSCFPNLDTVDQGVEAESPCQVQDGFLNLIETLANPLYVQIIWENLDFVCREIEKHARKAQLLGHGADAVPTVRLLVEGLPFTPRLKRREASLKELALEVSLDITSTLPQADRVLKVTFACNTAKLRSS